MDWKFIFLVSMIVLLLAAPFIGARLAGAHLHCGIPPIPPVGCEVITCECDSDGTNCRWIFACD